MENQAKYTMGSITQIKIYSSSLKKGANTMSPHHNNKKTSQELGQR